MFNTLGRHAATNAKTVSMFQARDSVSVLPHFTGSSAAANVRTSCRRDPMEPAFMELVAICAICMMIRVSTVILTPFACVTVDFLGSTASTMIIVIPRQLAKTVAFVIHTIGCIMDATVLALGTMGFIASLLIVTIIVAMVSVKWDDPVRQHATVASGSRVTCAK